MSYGASFEDVSKDGGHSGPVARGAKPGDLPIEQPTKFEFVVNLATARALGLNLPLTLLARADEAMKRSCTERLRFRRAAQLGMVVGISVDASPAA